MPQAKDYRKRLQDLGLLDKKGVELKASSVVEAKSALADIKRLQLELRSIKRELNLDIKSIRAEYQQQMPYAGGAVSAWLTLFGKRKAAGSARAAAKRQVSSQRDSELRDYEAVKQTVDDLLVQLERSKIAFQQYIEQNK